MTEAAVPRLDRAMLAVCALVPGCLAAAHAGNVADAAYDAGVARALGLAAGPWRSLDAVVAAALAWLPLGTRTARAELGEALVLAAAGAALYVLARAIAAQCAEAPRLGPMAAAVATLAVVCGPVWQLEGAAVAGSATGALLVLLPVAALAWADREEAAAAGANVAVAGPKVAVAGANVAAAGPNVAVAREHVAVAREHVAAPWRLAALLLGIALAYAPLDGAVALLACAALVGAGANARRGFVAACKADAPALGACLAAGLLPLVLALARTRAAGLPLAGALGDAWAGEAGTSHAGSPVAFVRGELGVVLGAMAAAGVALAGRWRRARALAAGLLAVTAAGFAAGWAGAALGPTRYGAPVLAAEASACALAAVAMQALVRAVAQARVPAARASAAMVLVLLLVLPVDAADEALLRTAPRARGTAALWDDAAWGELPAHAVVLVTDARLGRRAAAAQATGALRGDLAVVPAYAPAAVADRALASDPAMVPLWRDLALAGAPSEASLSSLATERPLAMAFEPRWGRVLGRHLVPVGLLDRFEPEPRGASDRRKALDAFAPARDRLTKAVAKDPELTQATAYLLRARALDVAASGDRDLVGRAVEDLRVFAPEDPVGTAIVARLVLGHGAGRLDDLRP